MSAQKSYEVADEMVELGLKSSIPLPVRIPGAVNGRDIVVLPSKKSRPVDGAVNVYGHNALVSKVVREAAKAQWPRAFEVATNGNHAN